MRRKFIKNALLPMFKNAIKRVQSRTCSSYAEREHFRRSQCSMLNVQWSMFNGQCLMRSTVNEYLGIT